MTPLPATDETDLLIQVVLALKDFGDDTDISLSSRWPDEDFSIPMIGYDIILTPILLAGDDLANFARKLEQFQYSPRDIQTLDGKTWLIGDGDDALASGWKRNGGFYIWLRHWPE